MFAHGSSSAHNFLKSTFSPVRDSIHLRPSSDDRCMTLKYVTLLRLESRESKRLAPIAVPNLEVGKSSGQLYRMLISNKTG